MSAYARGEQPLTDVPLTDVPAVAANAKRALGD